jgi:hypothetical protein
MQQVEREPRSNTSRAQRSIIIIFPLEMMGLKNLYYDYNAFSQPSLSDSDDLMWDNSDLRD